MPLVRACFSWDGWDGWAAGTAVAAVLRKAPAELAADDALTFALSGVTEVLFAPCTVRLLSPDCNSGHQPVLAGWSWLLSQTATRGTTSLCCWLVVGWVRWCP